MDIAVSRKREHLGKHSRFAFSRTVVRTKDLRETQKQHPEKGAVFVVGGGGFEPPKSETSDLQSDAFGHSANRPYIKL